MNDLAALDRDLAERYGAYASYTNTVDPVFVDTFGDGPTDEVDRLLDRFASPNSRILDLGCGTGFTVCRLAPQTAEVWGIDQDHNLLNAARERVRELGLTNVTLIYGDSTVESDTSQLPDDAFDVILSRRGPNINTVLLKKLRADGVVIQELVQDSLGLLEMFGRKSFLADIGDNPRWLVDEYSWFDLFPVSIKEYYYDLYFRDRDHLAAYLSQQLMLYSWPMPPMPYDQQRDQEALNLYAKYNTTPRGIRVLNRRNVYLFRRTQVQYAPIAPDTKPQY